MEDRWIVPGSKCDRCKRDRLPEECWSDTHCAGFTFNFCHECEKTDEAGCDKVMADCLVAWRRRCEKHWKENGPVV